MWLFLWAPKLPVGQKFEDKDTYPGHIINGAYTGEGRYSHLKLLVQALVPKFEFQDWSERALQSFCEYEQTAMTGCTASGKSTCAAIYALIWYACAPYDSAVLIASTTITASKMRIWKPLSEFFTPFRAGTGIPLNVLGAPKPRILPVKEDGKNDEAHGIHVVAVAKGETEKGIQTLKGFHPRRLLLVADEVDDPSAQAVLEVVDNLRAVDREFQAIWLGNDPSLLKPLGKLMQPSLHKPVTIEHVEWISEVSHVHCLRFDAFDSPNVRDGGKWRGIIKQNVIDAIVRRNGGENTVGAYVFLRGLHPPIGIDNTVLSESLLFRFHCFDSVVWSGPVITSALLDPAFGGDRCVIRKMMRGPVKLEQSADALQHPGLQPTNLRVLFGPPVQLTINAEDKVNPPEYQIAQQAMTFCKANDIPPSEFILDATGTGRGTASVIQREWSPSILVCEFGGAPSDMIVSEENPRPAKDEYDRRVTELYFAFREYVQADVIRGLDQETAREFCQREFEIKGKKYSVMTKTELKAEGKPSPDFSDNAVLGTELLRRKGIMASIQTEAKQEARDALEQHAKEFDLDEDYCSV